jgi:hypothetical protein
MVPDSFPGRRDVVVAAVLAGLVGGVGSVAVVWTRRLAAETTVVTGRLLAGIISSSVFSAVWFVPFLLAVLVAVAEPSRRAVAGGAALVYTADLVSSFVPTLVGPFPLRATVLVAPLEEVVTFLGIVTAVWLAYHGGYERLTAPLPDSQHPLFAVVAGDRIGADLSLQRGVVVALLAAAVVAVGLVAVGVVANFLRELFVTTAGRGSIVIRGSVTNAGIPLEQAPRRLLFEAAFLLGVLFVTGPRTAPRDLLKGVAVVFGTWAAVTVLPALVPPVGPVAVWEGPGSLVAPLGDTLVLAAVTLAVWLAFHDGLDRLRGRTATAGMPG